MSASAKAEQLRRQHGILQSIHRFFEARDFVAVSTPVLVDAPANEEYIDAIAVDGGYLRTSPELHMKRLVAEGLQRIYQLGPCFRQGEYGRRHRQEFTMLEWYQSPGDYRDCLAFTTDLLRACSEAVGGQAEYQGRRVDFSAEPEVLSVADAFTRYAEMDVRKAMAMGQFEVVLVEQVEPHLGTDRPTFLIDYPAEMASLARLKAGNPEVAERWELYLCGLEIANAYSELTDPTEQRRRFEEAADYRREQGRPAYPLDEAFLDALEQGMPETTGCALGIDRLLMILTDAGDIGQTQAFHR